MSMLMGAISLALFGDSCWVFIGQDINSPMVVLVLCRFILVSELLIKSKKIQEDAATGVSFHYYFHCNIN